jgi:hypothetical protein
MKKLYIGLFLLIMLALPAQLTTVQAAREGKPSRARFMAQSGGDTTIYLPLISGSQPASPNTSGFRQNARFLPDETWLMPSSIFWFGKVSPTENYVDVRTGYGNTALYISVEVFDRFLWYDTTPTAAELTQYDAISIYLRPMGVSGSVPDDGSYRFVAQSHFDWVSGAFTAAYRGNGSQWTAANVPFETVVGYEGSGGYNQTQTSNMGWLMTIKIPYSSLGLPGKPADGTAWAMAVSLHDRDDSNGPLPDKNWPPNMDESQPATWAELGFGLPAYAAPANQNNTSMTIRQGLNATSVPDASVGGSTICGEIAKPDFFGLWGDMPESAYAQYTVNNSQVNIQNQANVADWPCYAKYYVTFPLDALPAGKVITSAKLVMHMFGNSGNYENYIPQYSLIHVMTASSDWNENTITWNNAPLAAENFAATYVDPLPPPGFGGDLGVAKEWVISAAVAQAYRNGEPLRLVLYSSDLMKHSGKYFYSSSYSIPEARPTLVITYGDPVR